MRLAPSRVRRQRAQLDSRLQKGGPLAAVGVPRAGWLRAIREALGMSAQQLGERLGVTKQAVRAIEDGEAAGTASLRTLKRAAAALGCRLAYVIVPEETLEQLVDARARAVARKQLGRVRHSMALESQEPPSQLHDLQLEELVAELKAKRSHEIWDEP